MNNLVVLIPLMLIGISESNFSRKLIYALITAAIGALLDPTARPIKFTANFNGAVFLFNLQIAVLLLPMQHIVALEAMIKEKMEKREYAAAIHRYMRREYAISLLALVPAMLYLLLIAAKNLAGIFITAIFLVLFLAKARMDIVYFNKKLALMGRIYE